MLCYKGRLKVAWYNDGWITQFKECCMIFTKHFRWGTNLEQWIQNVTRANHAGNCIAAQEANANRKWRNMVIFTSVMSSIFTNQKWSLVTWRLLTGHSGQGQWHESFHYGQNPQVWKYQIVVYGQPQMELSIIELIRRTKPKMKLESPYGRIKLSPWYSNLRLSESILTL